MVFKFLPASWEASYRRQPLVWILSAGAIARLVAVLFSGGYIASDDHFLVVHVAWNWLNGGSKWLAGDIDRSGHSLLYPGAHFLFLWICDRIGFASTELQMVFFRLFHALWSLPLIWIGYRFAEKHGGAKAAELSGWLLAILWIHPLFAVRQLGEMVAAPPLFYALWKAEEASQEKSANIRMWLLAGLWMGLAFCIRYQTAFSGVGVVVALLLLRKPAAAAWFTIGALIGTLPLGIVDWFVYGSPYANPIHYFVYNSGALNDYITRPWYNYILLILGVFIPPLSVLLLVGFVRTWKRLPILFAGTFAFLFVHSAIPNKQERFIATILPELVVLGCIGIAWWRGQDKRRLADGWYRAAIRVFIVLNSILLIVALFTYNKRAEIKSLAYLQDKPISGVILDQRARQFNAPWFYLGKAWGSQKYLVEVKDNDGFGATRQQLETGSVHPEYVIIYLEKNREQRRKEWEAILGSIVEEKRFGPSLGDWILHRMNPRFNPSFDAVVYRIPGR